MARSRGRPEFFKTQNSLSSFFARSLPQEFGAPKLENVLFSMVQGLRMARSLGQRRAPAKMCRTGSGLGLAMISVSHACPV